MANLARELVPGLVRSVSSMDIAKNFAKMILIGITHIVVSVILFYQGRTHQSSAFDPFDPVVVVFLAPAVFAFIGYFLVIWFYVLPKRNVFVKAVAAVVIAFAATVVSSTCIISFAFNMWET